MTEREDKLRGDFIRLTDEIAKAVRGFEQAFLGYSDETIAEINRISNSLPDRVTMKPVSVPEVYDVEAHEVTEPIVTTGTISFGMPPPISFEREAEKLKERMEDPAASIHQLPANDPSDFWGLKGSAWYGDKPVPATPALLLFVGMSLSIIGLTILMATEGYYPFVRALFGGVWIVAGQNLSAYGIFKFVEEIRKKEV